MDSDIKALVITIFSIVQLIISLVCGVNYIDNTHKENMAKLGYIQVLYPGKIEPIWEKK